MNSLEFIKMHVDEWPSDTFNSVKLLFNGCAYFFDTVVGGVDVDLSEHFAPAYYDGVVWTREEFESYGSDSLKSPTLWTPTINSIVDVGDCEGVVKAIDGEHYWVLKDNGMYDTYHKGSLKQPVGGDVKAVMEATWCTKAEPHSERSRSRSVVRSGSTRTRLPSRTD